MIKDLIPQDILSEESLTAIENAFNERLQLHIEKALIEQDELYAEKLETLLGAINKDQSEKLVKVVEAIDSNNAKKLLNIVKKYESEMGGSAGQFKTQLVENLSSYLDAYIDEAIPAEAINEAVRNKQAITVLEGLRKTLAVDSALMKESIKDAVIEGKQQIEEATEKAQAVLKENAALKNELSNLKKQALIESKTSGMPATKKEYMKKILNDKELTFVKENFDYVSKLYDKKEAEQTEVIKEQALNNRVVKSDAPKIVTESKGKVDPLLNSYLSELGKMR